MRNLISNYGYAIVVAAITYAFLAATIAVARNTRPVIKGVSSPELVIPESPADSKSPLEPVPHKAESRDVAHINTLPLFHEAQE